MLKAILAYGTLRDDLGYRPIGPHSGTSLGLATAPGSMHTWGAYPMVVPSPGDHIVGQLLDFSHLTDEQWEAQLDTLDRYERVDTGLFERRPVVVTMEDGTEHDAWIYYCFDERQLSMTQSVPSGDWAEYIQWRLEDEEEA